MHQSPDNKDTLRSTIRQQRAKLSSVYQKNSSKIIVQRIYESSVFKHATHIAFYSPVQGEVNPLLLAQLSHKTNRDKKFYLPILQNADDPLLFAPTTEQSKFLNNRFSIPEPLHKKSELISPESLDLVLMPLLGFDKLGNRLGMGGGFYDRTFSFKKYTRNKPLLMGVAYDFQEVKSLTAKNWDIPLDYIVTESQLISFK